MALGQEAYEKFMDKFPKLGLNLHVCRIYRDARRLHGQGPYKDHLWLTIRPDNDIWSQQPVFWFEITPEEWSYKALMQILHVFAVRPGLFQILQASFGEPSCSVSCAAHTWAGRQRKERTRRSA